MSRAHRNAPDSKLLLTAYTAELRLPDRRGGGEVFATVDHGLRNLVHRKRFASGAVTIGIAAESARQTGERLGCIKSVAQSLTSDVNGAVFINNSHFFDRGEEDVHRVVGVRTEARSGIFAEFRLVLLEELETSVASDIRAGQIHANRARTGGAGEAGGEQAVSAHQCGVFEARNFALL